MGLDFIRQKGEQFTQKRDRSKEQEFDVGDLLTRSKPDAFVPLFCCQLTDYDAELIEGLSLLGRAKSENEVNILQAGKVIGYMLADDAARLTMLMRINHVHHGVITLILEQTSGIDGIFHVRPKKAFKNQN